MAALLLLSTVEAARADADLAKQLQNPIANLISVPIQSNFDFDLGPADGWRSTTNIQPVIPITLGDDWNMISRTIAPVIYQDDVAGDSGSQFGLGDTLQSLFLSPQKPVKTPMGNLVWGVGPAAQIPTSTDRLLGLGTFGLGPTGVALFQQGPWTYGALLNHVWGVVETRDNLPDLNNTFMQPFIVYTTQSAWSFSVNSELNYNWDAQSGEHLAGPINFGVAKLVKIGEQPVQIQGRLRWWAADTPASAEGLGYTVNVTFVFPK
ncbi:hypothetical protein H0I76_10020 [Limibaculum sp. M0105]|uniref:Transporter n=1 Tax=Thermohalobaculum xanthum TaxID=2753746 RepID=A0A8J7M8B0_9RHOB|nr:hypothetical protein [Thermohalobaculum xanthum]